MRELVLMVLLVTSATAVVVGVAMWCPPAAWVVGGVLAAVLSFVAVGEVGVAPSRPTEVGVAPSRPAEERR